MVLGEPGESSLAEEVGAAVAHVGHRERPALDEVAGDERGAHAGEVRIGARRAKTAWLAERKAERSRSSGDPARPPKQPARWSTAIRLATSPEAWPPSPSATAKRPASGMIRKASSLCLRFRPTSVAPMAASRMQEQ